jgi:hypothetical protein
VETGPVRAEVEPNQMMESRQAVGPTDLLALVMAQINDPQPVQFLEFGQDGKAFVQGSVVDKDKLPLHLARSGEQALGGTPQRRGLIEDGHND